MRGTVKPSVMDPNPECMDPYHYGNLYLHPQLHQLKIRIHPHQGSKLDPEPDGVGEYSPTQWFTPMTDRGWGKFTTCGISPSSGFTYVRVREGKFKLTHLIPEKER